MVYGFACDLLVEGEKVYPEAQSIASMLYVLSGLCSLRLSLHMQAHLPHIGSGAASRATWTSGTKCSRL